MLKFVPWQRRYVTFNYQFSKFSLSPQSTFVNFHKWYLRCATFCGSCMALRNDTHRYLASWVNNVRRYTFIQNNFVDCARFVQRVKPQLAIETVQSLSVQCIYMSRVTRRRTGSSGWPQETGSIERVVVSVWIPWLLSNHHICVTLYSFLRPIFLEAIVNKFFHCASTLYHVSNYFDTLPIRRNESSVYKYIEMWQDTFNGRSVYSCGTTDDVKHKISIRDVEENLYNIIQY